MAGRQNAIHDVRDKKLVFASDLGGALNVYEVPL